MNRGVLILDQQLLEKCQSKPANIVSVCVAPKMTQQKK